MSPCCVRVGLNEFQYRILGLHVNRPITEKVVLHIHDPIRKERVYPATDTYPAGSYDGVELTQGRSMKKTAKGVLLYFAVWQPAVVVPTERTHARRCRMPR